MIHFRTSKRILTRRGSLLTEGIIACLILGVAIGMLVPGLSAIGRQRKAMRFDVLAMIELNNIADAITLSEPAIDAAVSTWFSDRYADAEFTAEPLTISEDAVQELLEGLRLTIRRPQTEGMPDQKVSIVVWRAKGEPTP